MAISSSHGIGATEAMAVIGANIRNCRRARGMSLVDLAKQAGVARNTLSQLESGSGNPRMDTLYALANVLNLALSDILAPAPSTQLVRSGEGYVVSTSGLQARLLQKFSLSSGLLELSDLTIAAGVDITNAPHQPGIVEHVLVLEGILETGTPGEEVVLHPGDYYRFPGDRPHRYHAQAGPVRGTLLMEYPASVGLT